MYRIRTSFSNCDERDQPAARARLPEDLGGLQCRLYRCLVISAASSRSYSQQLPKAIRLWVRISTTFAEFAINPDRELCTMCLDQADPLSFTEIRVFIPPIVAPFITLCQAFGRSSHGDFVEI